jgi:hypothetical protein
MFHLFASDVLSARKMPNSPASLADENQSNGLLRAHKATMTDARTQGVVKS